jgi:hypothetical protein
VSFRNIFLIANLADQESGCLIPRFISVAQVRCENDKSTLADKVTDRAEHLQTVLRIVGNSAVVLLVLGVAEENGSNDLVAYGGAEIANSGGGESGALAGCVLARMKVVGTAEERTSNHQLQPWSWGTSSWRD